MQNPQSRFLTCQGRTIHFLESGDLNRDTVIIWHGVTGTCRDHEDLAVRLSADYHVVCPDSIGCGRSDWTHDKNNDPSLVAYAAIARDLIKQLGLTTVRWIGASKGGGLGIILAHIMTECKISHLVLNDIGPGFPEGMRQAALENIAHPPFYDNFLEFESYVRTMLSKGGLKLSDEKLAHLAHAWCCQTKDGKFTFHFDPALANQFRLHGQDFDLWAHYAEITAPTLLIRAEKSIIPDSDVARMRTQGPKCAVHNRPGGHISLMDDPEEQDVIINFLKN